MSETKDKTNIIVKDVLGEVHFSGGINQDSMMSLIDKILELENKIIKKCRSLKRKYKDEYDDEEDSTITFKVEPNPIKLYITSGGGSVYNVLSAIDTIKNMRIQVNTYVKGFAASAATLLSLSGKKRFITENSYMLIHEIRSATWGKFSEIKDDFNNMTVLNDHIKNYYIKNTKLTKEELDEQLKQDVIWNPEKCLEKGLVDEIIKSI